MQSFGKYFILPKYFTNKRITVIYNANLFQVKLHQFNYTFIQIGRTKTKKGGGEHTTNKEMDKLVECN